MNDPEEPGLPQPGRGNADWPSIDLPAGEAARAFLAAIVASSDDAIVGKTLDGIIRSWNPGAERVFGYTAAEAVGQSIILIIPPERRSEEDEILARLRAGQRIEHYETVRQRKDGTMVDISLTVSPVRDTAGRLIGASKVARDISERKQVERELREADRRKNEFLATLAHELRNPLAPIRNSIEILQIGALDAAARQRNVAILDRQTAHLERLVDDLLDLSRISSGKIELRLADVDVGEIVESAAEATRPLIDAAGQRLEIELPDADLELRGDATRLAQVVTNLLNNATRYGEPGGEVRVRAERDGDTVVIAVSDTGVGIPPESRELIFDLFAQGEAGPRGGLGIGLALSRYLVELHGGTICALSEGAGRGSTFVVRLPIAQGVGEDSSAAPRAEPPPAAPPQPMRVLIVDDNRDAADSLHELLRVLEFDAHTVYGGEQALAVLDELRPQAALIDLGMPGLDGLETARRIRARESGAEMTLVALTGWGQEQDREQTRAAGFDHHLVKPAAVEQLLAALRSRAG